MAFRPRRPQTTYMLMESLSRKGKDCAREFGHDMGRYERSTDHGIYSSSPVNYSAVASCRRCCAQVRVSTAAVEQIQGDALGPKTCQQIEMEKF